ncbi:phage tail tape measure protein, lambda family [Shimia marina]|uniref:Phage tail tape measure protein, lambda family n=2 Tax=Shimia marina TaxID=321267 RepID=A0A0P1FFC8_9RHOB|nr:phage tail tape measure protein, lambda family [Shimia marina]SFD76380.1 phage tail tape measure protein, lambda family [Shimia marina]
MDDLEDFEGQVEALEGSLGQATAMVAGFDGELRRMQQALGATGQDMATLEKGIGRGLRKAFDGLAFDGMKLSDALQTLAQSMIDAAYRAAITPVVDQIGEAVSGGIGGLIADVLPFAQGAGFAQGRVMPFAQGGVVSGPVSFPMRGGRGLMGEAGPEAILPLSRGADGKLGVRDTGGGGGPVRVVMNISTPDVAGFQRSQGQVATQMSRALSRAQRNR